MGKNIVIKDWVENEKELLTMKDEVKPTAMWLIHA